MSGRGDNLVYNIGGAEENQKNPSLGCGVSTPRYDPYTFCENTEGLGQLCVIIRMAAHLQKIKGDKKLQDFKFFSCLDWFQLHVKVAAIYHSFV